MERTFACGNGVTIDSCKITTDIPDTEHITIVNIGRSGEICQGSRCTCSAIAFTNNIVSGTISIVPSYGKVLKANVSHNLIGSGEHGRYLDIPVI